MEFQITPETLPTRFADHCDTCSYDPRGQRWLCPDLAKHVVLETTTSYTWALVTAAGEHIAHGPCVFYDEKSCRSQIAQAKKSMKGAMRCKVVTL